MCERLHEIKDGKLGRPPIIKDFSKVFLLILLNTHADTHADGVGKIILLTMEARMISQIKTMTHYFKLRCGTRRTATPVGIIHKYLWSEH